MGRIENQLNLSKITLGTMRFFDKNLSVNDVTSLLEKAYDIGINTHHSSFEYNSYELYTKALSLSPNRKNIKHVVKLSSPHFEDTKFSSNILEERVDNQLKALNTECIDVLQWLVRSKPINDHDRLSTLKQQKHEIEQCLFDLKAKGKVKSIFSFPYSVPFAKEVIKVKEIDGVISYLNKQEVEYSEFANSIPFIAIRPFFGGQLFEGSQKNTAVSECLEFVNSNKTVISTIAGINTIKQLNDYKNNL